MSRRLKSSPRHPQHLLKTFFFPHGFL